MDHKTITLSFEEKATMVILVCILIFMLIMGFVHSFMAFKKERDYIKMEIGRSFEEEEYLYWKRELRILYISAIPIVRDIVLRKYK